MPESDNVLSLLALELDITAKVHSISTVPVARGGFADIFEAMWDHDGAAQKVALKVVHVSNHLDMRTSRRLLREISIWKSAFHPNIHSLCGLYEHTNGLPAMVSPWCRNGDINRYLKTQQENPHLDELKLRLLSQAVQGLEYLHGKCIVHADLKGGNVLISDDGVARLADFGLSALRTSDPRTSDAFTSTSTVAGTYRWMAPELINENNARHTYASDIWAAGCLIIEVQSGAHPYYSAKNEHHVLLAIGRRKPPPRPPNMPDFLWSLVTDCCEIRAEDRGSVVTLAIDLLVGTTVLHKQQPSSHGESQTVAGEDNFSSDPETMAYQRYAAHCLSELLTWIPFDDPLPTWRPIQGTHHCQHRLFSPSALRPLAKEIATTDRASAAKLMLMFSHPIVETLDIDSPYEELCTMIELPGERLLGISIQAFFTTSLVVKIIDLSTQRVWRRETALAKADILAFTPDRQFVAVPAEKSPEWVNVHSVQTGHIVHLAITRHTARITTLAFSPDALRLASGCADGSIRILDLASGTTLNLAGPTNADTTSAVVFSFDGARLASTSWDGLRVWDALSGQCVFGPILPHPGSPDVSPPLEHAEFRPSISQPTFSPDGRYVAFRTFHSFATSRPSYPRPPRQFLCILDTYTQKHLFNEVEGDMINHLSYSPETARQYLLSQDRHAVVLREVATGVPIAAIHVDVSFERFAWYRNGRYLATIGNSEDWNSVIGRQSLTIFDPTWFLWDV